MRLLYFTFYFIIIKIECNPCPDGTFPSFNNDKCYFVPNYTTQWTIAKTHCRNNQFGRTGHLASIESSFDNANLTSKLQDILNQSVSVWLGGNDLGSNGVWTWIDGHNMTYTNWVKGNPINDSISNCMVLKLSSHGLWFSQDCYENIPFVCEISACPPCNLPCPDGWTYFSDTNYCYKTFYNGSKFNFSLVEKICEQNNGHLASIHSTVENEFIINLSYWQNFIGLYYYFGSNTFNWTDNSKVDYTNWDKNQPNLANSQYCVGTGFPLGNKLWSTSTCDNGYSFTCKQKPIEYENGCNSNLCCPDGWTFYSKTNFCYNHFNYHDISFSAAESFCIEQGGHQVSIHSQDENNFLHAYFSYYDWPWIGLTYSEDNDTFVWTDNTPVDYQNWAAGEPNTASKGYCAYMIYNNQAWYTMDCSANRDFVCKKSPNINTGK